MSTDLKIRLIIFIAIAGVVIFAFVRAVSKVSSIFSPQASELNISEVIINNQNIGVSVARTVADQTKGLSGRNSLEQDEGMLFVYDKETLPTFWMKEMRFPIDIIWIQGGQVVDISRNLSVPVSSDLPTYSPRKEVDKALEVNAGFAENKEIQVGDKVTFR